MNLRTRVLLAFAPVVLVPLLIFGFGVRRVIRRELAGQFEARVGEVVQAISSGLDREREAIGARLAAVREAATDDNRLRLAAVQGALAERPYLLDYAALAMRSAGLEMLQLQDEAGRILSSGHFRNEYDRLEPGLPRSLAAVGGWGLVHARTPETPMLVLARLDTLRLGGRTFTLAGGRAIERVLPPAAAADSIPWVGVTVVTPMDTVGTALGAQAGDQIVSELLVPYAGPPAPDTARIIVSHSLAPLAGLHRKMDVLFLVAVLASVAVALVLASWLASRIARPIAHLAGQAEGIDLEGPDVPFDGTSGDEVGALSRVLRDMALRVKAGAARLREFERRAAMGDLARQVNHDVKNGLAPLRNVLRHLAQVTQQTPEQLPQVFRERQQTLESSVAYLEGLATNYAQLYPEMQSRPIDVNRVVRETLRHVVAPAGADLREALVDPLPSVRGDALVIRRILENVIGNAIEALEGRPGTVTISTAAAHEGRASAVRITVLDTGRGMSKAELDRAFDDFYTTKPGGTGLGLSIVRRLVNDLGGRLGVQTEPGVGTTFTVELPGWDGKPAAP